MAGVYSEKILVLAKTYPSPSAQYIETSCIAGVNEDGEARRLYPVPFRLIEQDKQFYKWQWVNVRVRKSISDHRKESHHIDIDTILPLEHVSTKNFWIERRRWWEKLPIFNDFSLIEQRRKENGTSLAILRPKRLIRLEIVKSQSDDWTEEEKKKLKQGQMQGQFFSAEEAIAQIRQLRKMPYDLYYVYECEISEKVFEYKHKIVDWEACALFWNCYRQDRNNWEDLVRNKLEYEFKKKDLMFFMGNIHKFPNQWLIISLIYPPRRKEGEMIQESLF